MAVAVRTEQLTKDYGNGRGLFDLNLEVPAGCIFGYLGPNGAGKSTTIRLLMGLVRPTRGRAFIFGLDCWSQAVEVKRHLGYLPGELPDFGPLRGWEVIAYLGAMAGGVDRELVDRLCDRLQLDLGVRFREYSAGNKKKLGLVLAFMRRPRLLVLDEPTAGLDPLNQREFHSLLREARNAGGTVFLSSHVLSEVDQVCDLVGIIRGGRLARVASLDELRDIRLHRVEIEFAGRPPIERIRTAGVDDVVVEDHRLHCTVRGSMGPLLEAICGAGVLSLTSHEPSLEEAFLRYYTGTGEPPPGTGRSRAPA